MENLRRFLVLFALTQGAILAGQWPNSAISQDLTVAEFRPAECWFKRTREISVDCGYLAVPETYNEHNDRFLQLPVAIFNPESDAQPLLYVDGGPGSDSGISSDRAGRNWEETISSSSFLQNRPIIVMAQRGTADETSSLLKCSILGNPKLRIGLSYSRYESPDLEEQIDRHLINCRDQAIAAGYDLRAYTTENSARDIIALRESLGLPKWDILAISYGTRPTLFAAMQDEAHIGAIVIDGPDIPGSFSSFQVADYFNRSFQRLERDCLKIKTCARRFPDMRGYLESLMEYAAEQRPWTAFRKHGEDRISYLRLSPQRVMNTLYNGFYTEGAIALMPRALLRSSRKDHSIFGAVSGSILLDPFYEQRAYGMALSIDCTEFDREAASAILDEQERQGAIFEPLVSSRRNGLARLCPLWLGESYYEHRPSIKELSKIETPLLILSGVYDPVTPVEVIKPFKKLLPNSQSAEVPAMGHGVLFKQNCTAEIVRSFLEAPHEKLDSSCLDDIAQFPDFNLNTSPPMPEPFVKLKSYDSKIKK